jgi:hypothetical protein
VWRTTRPWLSTWEDACADGLIDYNPEGDRIVSLSPKGQALLDFRLPKGTLKHKPIFAATPSYQRKVKATQLEGARRWLLLRGGKAEQEEGLRLIREAYAQESSPSGVMELGISLLWLRQYAEAWQHFHSVIETDPSAGDNDYGMAGVAKWCLGEPEEAVAQWRAGLKAKYARSGVAVRMALLVFFASVVMPEFFEQDEAKKLLMEKADDPRIRNWPGPIVKLILGQINEGEFQESRRGKDLGETRTRLWYSEFYWFLLGRERVTLSAFKDSMRKLADPDQPEWRDANMVSELWCEEFFLARHEGGT